MLHSDWKDGGKKINEPLSMSCIFVVEIDAVIFNSDLEDLIISAMLQDKLLDQEKCFFVVHMLSNLNHSSPSVRSKFFFTVVALHINLSELCDKCLFHFGLVADFLLNCKFNFDPLGVRFSPEESGLKDFGSAQTLDFLEQNGKKLFAISRARHPRWPHITMTKSAEINHALFCDS